MGDGTRRLLAAAILAALTAPAAAQEVDALARDYVALPAVQGMMDDMFSAEALLAQFVAQVPPGMEIAEEKRLRIGNLMSEAMAALRPEVEAVMAESSAATFTAGELAAMIDFYRTEEGAAVLGKMQPMLAAFSEAIAPRLRQAQEDIAPEVLAILSE